MNRLFYRSEPWGSIIYEPSTDLFTAIKGLHKEDSAFCKLKRLKLLKPESNFDVEALNQNEIKKLNTSFPLSLLWSPTQLCNLKCKYCFADDGFFEHRHPSSDEFEYVLRIVKEQNVLRLDFSGGEPFLRKDLVELVAKTAQVAAPIVTTNGMFVTEAQANELAQFCASIQVSLDSADPAINDSVRGPGSFQGALTAIRHFLKAGISVKAICVVHSANVQHLRTLLSLLDSEGVYECKFMKCMPSRTKKWDDKLIISSKQFERAVTLASKEFRTQVPHGNLQIRDLDYDRDKGGCIILEENGMVYQMGSNRIRHVGSWKSEFNLANFDTKAYYDHLRYYIGVHSGYRYFKMRRRER